MSDEADTIDADKVRLRVNGRDFSGWTSVKIDMSLEDAVSSFAVVVSGVYATSAGFIREDDDLEVWVGDDLLITGVVDDLELGGDADTASVSITGRSRLRDLVDCSAPLGAWRGMKLLALIKTLVAAYGIDVVDECGVGDTVIRSHRTEEGEALFDALDRLSRDHAFIVTDDSSGRIVLTQAGKGGLVVGDKVVRGTPGYLSGNAKRSCGERFSAIVCKGQSIGDADVEVNAQGAAEDVGVRRFRQLIVRPERGVSSKSAAKRARWEVATRAAKALEYTCSLRGWRDAQGRLWRKNTLVEVLDGFARIYGAALLVVSVSLSLDTEGGRVTALRLVPPEAFTPLPIAKPSVSVGAYAYEQPPSTAPDDALGDE